LNTKENQEIRQRETQERLESQASQPSEFLGDFYDNQDEETLVEYHEWLEEKARRRIIFLESELASFASLNKETQRRQLEFMNERGLTFEDIIDRELERQEKTWRKSLSQSPEDSLPPTQQPSSQRRSFSTSSSSSNRPLQARTSRAQARRL
jgi:hypothetical protein